MRSVLISLTALVAGALVGILLMPPPADAVAKEIIQLQEQVSQLLQITRDLQRAEDQHHAELKTLVEQSLDASNRLNTGMGSLQKTVQDMQAASGSRTDSLTTQVQGISDNMQDLQSRMAKLSQQMTDLQGVIQSLDAKVSGTGGGAAPGAGQPPASSSAPPMSADTLYSNALRDYTTGKYELARGEFTDYIKYFPANDLAGNSQFYLAEIDYSQGQFQPAIAGYDKVITEYPKCFKLPAAHLKKGQALLELGKKTDAIREFRETVRRYPGTDEAKRAQAKLRELGVR